MKTRNWLNLAGALTLGIATLASPSAQAQPLDDRVIVDMPYTTSVGHKTLQPGHYVIQRLSSQSGGGRVLLIYSDNGMKFETSVMTIPCLDINTARDTKVILSRIGDDYYYNKIWVQGKQYGYEIPLPKSVRLRQKELMAQVSVPASTSSSSTITTTTTTASAEPTPVPEEQVFEQPEAAPAPVVAEEQLQEQQPEQEQVQEQAQTQEEVDANANALPESSANREMDQNPSSSTPADRLPKTAVGWLAMMLGGSTLLSGGLMLRRKS